MHFKNKILTVITILLFSAALMADELVVFYSKLAGNRDIYVDFTLKFHVKGEEEENFEDFELGGFIAIRNLTDFYLYIREPSVIEGIKFVYLGETNRLYSGFNSKMYLDVVNLKRDFIAETVKAIVDVITSPVFITRRSSENGCVTYKFVLINRLILKRFGIEPINIEATFKEGELKDLMIYYGEEYVKLVINELNIGKDVSKYFEIIRGS